MFKEFLKVVSLYGGRVINEVEIKTKGTDTTAMLVSPDESVAISVVAKEVGLPDGVIGVQNIPLLQKFLSDNKDVVVKVKENRLELKSGNKKLSSILKNVKFITSNSEPDKYNTVKNLTEKDGYIEVSVANLKKIKDYMDMVKTDKFKLTTKDGVVTVDVGEDNTDSITDTLDCNVEGAKDSSITLGKAFIDVVFTLDNYGVIRLYVKDESPVRVVAEKESLRAEALVALYG